MVKIYENGSCSICIGNTKESKEGIKGMFPGIDQMPVRAVSVTIDPENNGAAIETGQGKILFNYNQLSPDKGIFTVKCRKMKQLVHTLSVFYEAELIGLQGIYQAAHGMGDDTGYISIKELMKKEEIISDALCSLKFSSGIITFYGADHSHYRNTYCIRRKGEKFYFSCNIFIEHTDLNDAVLPGIGILTKGTMEEQLADAAREIGHNMHARACMEPAFHWCSWYYCYHNFDHIQLEEYLEGFHNLPEAEGIRYFQIDAGYFPSAGDWLISNERFPQGLKAAFDKIKEYGYIPGIWIGPFMVGNRSRLYKEHSDWILYDQENIPVKPWIWNNEPKPWGYQDEEYYVLDTSHPDAMEYMKNVFSTLKKWGAGFFKTDFTLWGIQDSARVKRFTPGKTSVEYFREFLDMIRGEIGEESYWLGCIAPFLPFVGYADGMRVGGDVGSSWKGEFSPQNMIQSVSGNVFCNYSYYQIDPDAVMLRNFHIELTEKEVNSLALLGAMSGGCIYTSDPLHRIAERRRKLFHFIKPDRKRKPYMPFLDQERKEIVMVHKEKNALILAFNGTDSDIHNDYCLSDFGMDCDMQIYDFDSEKKLTLDQDIFHLFIPAHGHRLLKASKAPDISFIRDSLWKNLSE